MPASAVELFGVSVLDDGSTRPEGGRAFAVAFEIENDDGELSALLSGVSQLVAQSEKGADAFTLAALARGDIKRLTAALYGEARYGADIDIRIAGAPIDAFRPEELDETSAAPLSIVIRVKPGPMFRFGSVTIDQTESTVVGPPSEPRHYALVSGEPAKSALIVRAFDRLIEEWRYVGYPFAQISEKEVVADHDRSVVDVRVVVAPGDAAVYGWINVTGTVDLDSRRVVDQTGLASGQRFNPRELKATRERLRKFESIESVRVIEGEQVDDGGGIPITVEVRERKSRFFGAMVSASTIDGVELQTYWGHRNLLGEGERLRVDGTVSQIGVEGLEQLQFDVGATFTKPGVLDIDTDLFSELRFVREHPDTYESLEGNARVGLAHRYDRYLSGSVALEGSQSRIEDAFGTTDYTLLSLPAELVYDSRNNRLDPKTGVNAVVGLNPVAELSASAAFGASALRMASYVPLDEEDRAILAARIIAGSDFGASLSEVPATYRFFAGGGGSVRGYEYRSLGPTVDGRVVGGLSMLGASAELRVRVSESWGLVPFVDVATVSADSVPSFSDPVFVGAGLGVRYYTSLGPLRLDLAAPVTNREGQPSFGAYVGLGQAF